MWREGWRGMGRSKEGDMGLRKVSLATRPDWNRISDVKYTPHQIAIWVMSYEYSGASLTWFWMNSSTSGNSRSFISSEGWHCTASGPAGNNIIMQHILNTEYIRLKADILAFSSWWWKGIKMREGNKGTLRNKEVRHIPWMNSSTSWSSKTCTSKSC